MAASPSPPRPPLFSPPKPPMEAGSKFKARSFEDQVRLAYHTPPPGHYSPNHVGRRSEQLLGKISEARVLSALDHGQSEKSLVPGPGSYETPEMKDMALPEGGRLNRKPPEERFRLDEYPSPAPGAYGVPHDPTVPRQLFGSFGKDPRVSKFIEDEVNRSKQVPAPGSNDVMESMESVRPGWNKEGGRYLEQGGRSRGYFDSAAKLEESKPGPGRYNLPGAIKANPSKGKLVWRYQSETLEQTKKVITKIVGEDQNPAPGHYTLPDPKPIAPSPTLKGRSTGAPMPHPYAYNCAPDHANKFSSPVRDQNSGDQIFGRDLKKGSTGTPGKDRTAKAKDTADEIAAQHMPLTLAERSIEQPGETVQWRSGGFSALKMVKSSPVINRREHPGVEDMMKKYQPLSKVGGRKNKEFMPEAVKRPEIVKTSSKSDEYQSLQRKKWELGALAAEITSVTAATMEPLDVGKLRDQATRGLVDKARFKMRMEGLGKEQQDQVLAELPGVLSEVPGATASTSARGEAAEAGL